jgi:hypothetical protein
LIVAIPGRLSIGEDAASVWGAINGAIAYVMFLYAGRRFFVRTPCFLYTYPRTIALGVLSGLLLGWIFARGEVSGPSKHLITGSTFEPSLGWFFVNGFVGSIAGFAANLGMMNFVWRFSDKQLGLWVFLGTTFAVIKFGIPNIIALFPR